MHNAVSLFLKNFPSAQIEASAICDLSRLAEERNALNLAEGLPDFSPPTELIQAYEQVCKDSPLIHQAQNTWGLWDLRLAIHEKLKRFEQVPWDPETEITITTGATEALYCAMAAFIQPGDEVILFTPFYEPYLPSLKLLGATPRFVPCDPQSWQVDETSLKQAFNKKTKVILLNSPNNPTGHVLQKEELELIAKLCQEWNVLAFSDEVYEHLIYSHPMPQDSIARYDGMRERSVVFNSVSKTYSATGWRVGYAAACPQLSDEIRKVHDLLSAGTNSLAQQAAVAAYKRPGSYYQKLLKDFIERKAVLEESLARLELDYFSPEGGYYLWADIRSLGYIDDLSFCQDLIQHAGVAVVPGRCFTQGPSPYVRFCFAKKVETLQEASQRLKKLTPKRS